MIDTDKYEGHTREEWHRDSDDLWFHRNGKDIQIADILIRGDGEDVANAQLIADAPKLLAEVERLREQNKLMVDYFRFMRDVGLTDDDWRTVNEWIGDEEE